MQATTAAVQKGLALAPIGPYTPHLSELAAVRAGD